MTILILAASLVGIFDSFYLVNSHYNGGTACSSVNDKFLGIRIDCGAVDTSKYSEIFGISVALFGFLYYLTMFLIIYFDTSIINFLNRYDIPQLKYKPIMKLIAMISSLGFLFTLYLVNIQVNILHVICKYCMYSALTTTVIFASSWINVFHPESVII